MPAAWTNLNGARLVRTIAVVLMVVGLVFGIGVTWQWLAKVRHISAEQGRLEETLTAQWSPTWTGAAGRTRVGRIQGAATGAPIARLHLPTLSQTLVVVEGAEEPQLDKGPGRLAGTAPFGQPGNTALAGHRYPGVFWNLDLLEAGDPVVVETAASWLVYRTVRTVIVQPVDEAVLAAPPGERSTMLTLITCEPKLSTAQRLVKQAELVRTDDKGGEAPRELKAKTRR
jgi:sortase A